MADHGVDFVECQPVLDSVLIAVNDRSCEVHEEVDRLSVVPAVVFQNQMQRRFVMGNGNQRFNIVLLQFCKYIVIELQAFFIRCFFITLRVNTAPGDGHTEYFESHLCEQADIFLPMMVEIGTVTFRIVYEIFRMSHCFQDVLFQNFVLLCIVLYVYIKM